MEAILTENKRLQQENENMLIKLEEVIKKKEQKGEGEEQEIEYMLEQKKNLSKTLNNQDNQIYNLDK